MFRICQSVPFVSGSCPFSEDLSGTQRSGHCSSYKSTLGKSRHILAFRLHHLQVVWLHDLTSLTSRLESGVAVPASGVAVGS